ncbi:MAG TPA: glycosyltransferase family 39 protein [Candidatus Binatia bacterium]|jgi:4-amino-4-deoxy-L-arabinose transferase-like glycosyltransferase
MSGTPQDDAGSVRSQDLPFRNLAADQPFPRQTQLFVLLMLVSIGLRLWLLIVSRHYLRSDEAVVAMEALDIMEGGPIPFFLYRQAYGGGHTVEALLAIPWFSAFGPSDYLFKLGPALLSCVYVAVVYVCLYQFFNKRYALIAATLFSLFAPFLAFNFLNNGGGVATLFGWVGLYFFLRAYFTESQNLGSALLAGGALGFAYYCFDYALYFLAAVLTLWIVKDNIRLWRQWKAVLALLVGFVIGASPLIYYNLTHDFENIKYVFARAARPDPHPVLGALGRFARLLGHDLPAFFSLNVEDFPSEISLISYFSYGLFLIAVFYAAVKMKPAFFSMARAFFTRRTHLWSPGERIVYVLLLLLLDLGIYSLASAAESRPRYLIILCPLIPLVVAWAGYDLGRRHLIPGAIFTVLFGALQIPFIFDFAKDKTVLEWDVRTHGDDVKTLAKFLLDENLTTVVTPYEIKWKLMFESRRRIVCAAYLFGFDREQKYNLEVIRRVNNEGAPLAFVFDKEYKLVKVQQRYNPKAGFDVSALHDYLRQNRIAYRTTPVGEDYIVYHGFSKRFPLAHPYR